MKCDVCNRELNLTQWSADESLKSCPGCSKSNGAQHVFFKYPEKFGTTSARSTPLHPEGPQSYCSDCRAESKVNLSNAVYCQDVKIK